MTLPLQPNLVGLTLAPAQCVYDPELESTVWKLGQKIIDRQSLKNKDLIANYVSLYRDWISSTDVNQVTGLDQFPVAAYSNGTSEAFDKFYLKHHNRRFRCFRGEYLYHSLAWGSQFDWMYIEDGALLPNDAVVVSLPFADTGNQHHLYNQEFLNQCHTLGIPVLLDCAFFGICADIKFDFTHPAITDICFSLSKSFPVNNFRIGIRFTKTDDHDSLLVYHKTGYIHTMGAALGIELLSIQSPDHVFTRYRDQQVAWCEQFNLTPSSTVIFGLDFYHQYDQYNRGMVDSNRICFAKHFNNPPLPTP